MGAAESIFFEEEEEEEEASIEHQHQLSNAYPISQQSHDGVSASPRQIVANINHGPPRVVRRQRRRSRADPPKLMHGLILGLPASGKRTLFERLKGKDPFVNPHPPITHDGNGVEPADNDPSTYQAIVPYQAPAGSPMYDTLQIKVQVSPHEVPFDSRIDFAIILVNPKHNPNQVQAKLNQIISDLLKHREYTRQQQNQSETHDTQQSRYSEMKGKSALCMCFLVNFRDLQTSKKRAGLQQTDIKQFVLGILQQNSNRLPPQEQILLQFVTTSLLNCYGLSTLHHFIYQAYLRFKQNELEQQLLEVRQEAAKSTETPHVKYKDFLKMLADAGDSETGQRSSRELSSRQSPRNEPPPPRSQQQAHEDNDVSAARNGKGRNQSQRQNVTPEDDPRTGRRNILSSSMPMEQTVESKPEPQKSARDALEAFLASDDEEEDVRLKSNPKQKARSAMSDDDDDDDDFFYDESGNRRRLHNARSSSSSSKEQEIDKAGALDAGAEEKEDSALVETESSTEESSNSKSKSQESQSTPAQASPGVSKSLSDDSANSKDNLGEGSAAIPSPASDQNTSGKASNANSGKDDPVKEVSAHEPDDSGDDNGGQESQVGISSEDSQQDTPDTEDKIEKPEEEKEKSPSVQQRNYSPTVSDEDTADNEEKEDITTQQSSVLAEDEESNSHENNEGSSDSQKDELHSSTPVAQKDAKENGNDVEKTDNVQREEDSKDAMKPEIADGSVDKKVKPTRENDDSDDDDEFFIGDDQDVDQAKTASDESDDDEVGTANKSIVEDQPAGGGDGVSPAKISVSAPKKTRPDEESTDEEIETSAPTGSLQGAHKEETKETSTRPVYRKIGNAQLSEVQQSQPAKKVQASSGLSAAAQAAIEAAQREAELMMQQSSAAPAEAAGPDAAAAERKAMKKAQKKDKKSKERKEKKESKKKSKKKEKAEDS